MGEKAISTIWFGTPSLLSDEFINSSYIANHSQNKYRAVGGKLHFTNLRLLYYPHLLDRILFGKKLSFAWNEIKSTSVEPSGTNLFNGSLRERLKIQLVNGEEYFFVVDGIEALRIEIANACKKGG